MGDNEFDMALDSAVHAVLAAFDLSAEDMPDTAEAINEALTPIMRNVTEGEED